MSAKFEIAKNSGGEFIFRLKAANGENILRSEGYRSKSSAQNGIESVRKNSQLEERYEKLTAKNGQFYFNLLAANSQVVGTSETYTTERSRDEGMTAVRKNAAKAKLVDATAAG